MDIMAKALALPAKTAADVSTWYERYISYYRVIALTDDTLNLENIINDMRYTVRLDIGQHNAFKSGQIVFGSIVPYGDYWYWSGMLQNYGNLDQNRIDELRKEIIRKAPKIVYRYDKQLLAKAKAGLTRQYKSFVAYFGDELAIFKDGLSMAAALQKKERQKTNRCLKTS